MIQVSSFHTRWTPWPGVLLLTGVLFGASAGASAQTGAPSQAPVATPDQPLLQPALPLDGPTAMVFHTVKADRMVEFEALFTRLREALALSDEAARRSQAAGWRLLKQNAPTAEGHLLYVSVIDPVVPGQEYDIARLLAEAFPAEGAALYQSLLASHVQPTVQASNLTLVTSLAPAAAAAPAEPATPGPPAGEEPPS